MSIWPDPGSFPLSMAESVFLLQEVWFHGNLLESLPEGIGNLEHLEKLSVSGNRLQKLPHSISNLLRLKELALAGNRLQELPSSIGSLSESCKRLKAGSLGEG